MGAVIRTLIVDDEELARERIRALLENDARYAVLLDRDGSVAEGRGWNIFALTGGVLVSPDAGALEGITRKTVYELSERLNIEARAGRILKLPSKQPPQVLDHRVEGATGVVGRAAECDSRQALLADLRAQSPDQRRLHLEHLALVEETADLFEQPGSGCKGR